MLSDPYVAGGNHLPDWVIARPIFVAGDGDGAPVVAGFCCNRAHQSDIGGGLAGTYNPKPPRYGTRASRLPVLKLVDRGEVRDDVWELLLINSRTPELLDGDLRAMLGSTQIGAERVIALTEELGVDPYLRYLGGVLDHADRRMRAAVAGLPDGVYRGEDHCDNDCFERTDIAIRVTLTVRGDELVADFSGSDPQIAGFKNSSLANTYSSVYLALASFFDTSIPRNEGTYRCLTVVAPEGTIVNARPPAPMTMNTVFVAHEIVHSVWRALAEADPGRACAGWSKTMHNHVTARDENGAAWVMYQWHAMGTPGATAERDGFPQMGHLITLGGLDLPNLEFYEQMYPVRYLRHEQRLDNGGAGARRGGTGMRYEADVLVSGHLVVPGGGPRHGERLRRPGRHDGWRRTQVGRPPGRRRRRAGVRAPEVRRAPPGTGPGDRRHPRRRRLGRPLRPPRPNSSCGTCATKSYPSRRPPGTTAS